MKLSEVIVTFVVGFVSHSDGLDNGLARTPPMGWMHWERFRCITDCKNYPDECISENLFKRTADLLVLEGFADAGYRYVIIDDCWLEPERDIFTKKLVPDRIRFPSGFNSLADYIHGKGLKFGLYQDYGTHTCRGYPGVINHMELDAQTFADWNVDYVKLDGCYSETNHMEKGFAQFGHFLNKTGRPVVYSCSWPYYQYAEGHMPNYEGVKKTCNLWRNYKDVEDTYRSVISIINYYGKNQDIFQPQAGPGHWNDPDMLILGNFGLSYDHSKTQMAIWAILAAPLIMSNDLRTIRPEIKDILLNRQIIEVNQDSLGIQGKRILTKKSFEVWTRPINPINIAEEYSYAVAFVSHRMMGSPHSVVVTLKELDLRNRKGYRVADLYNISTTRIERYMPLDAFTTRVNPMGVTFFKFIAV